MGKEESRKFEDAELIGITVEQTFWDVWLPNDREVTKSSGNMAEVVEVAREVEKGRAAVEELKSLNKLLASDNLDAATWYNAQANFDYFCRQVDMQVATNTLRLSDINSSAEKVKLQTGKDQLQQKLSELTVTNGGISADLSQAVADNRKLQDRNNARFANQSGEVNNFNQQQAAGMHGDIQGQFGSVSANGQLQFAQSQVSQSEDRWKNNARSAQKLVPTAQPGEAKGDQQNFYLNDNIVLKERREKAITNQSAEGIDNGRGNNGKKDLADKESFEKFSQSVVGNADEKKALDGLDENKREGGAGGGRGSNYSRGNRAQFEEAQLKAQVAQQLQPQPQRIGANTPATSPIAAVTPPPLAAPANPVLGATLEDLPVLQAPGGMGIPAGPAARTGLEATGRISLAVDFPTEGQVFHFQKIKSNAQLEIQFKDTKPGPRWGILALFALAALPLWFFTRPRARLA
jgi:hypothetical protein